MTKLVTKFQDPAGGIGGSNKEQLVKAFINGQQYDLSKLPAQYQ